MNTADIVKPIVCLNGSGRDALIQEQLEAIDGIDHALEALADAAPHARDFQLKPELYSLARTQHEHRVEAISKVKAELLEILNSLTGE